MELTEKQTKELVKLIQQLVPKCTIYLMERKKENDVMIMLDNKGPIPFPTILSIQEEIADNIPTFIGELIDIFKTEEATKKAILEKGTKLTK